MGMIQEIPNKGNSMRAWRLRQEYINDLRWCIRLPDGTLLDPQVRNYGCEPVTQKEELK